VPGTLATALCVWMVAKQGAVLVLPALLLKIIVLGMAWFVRREYGDRTLPYFTNLGLSPRVLWMGAVAIDLIIFVICVTATILIR